VKGALSNSVEAGRLSETLSGKALQGKADLADVVMAVNNAEISLQAVTAIRDRLVNGIQELMRMPI
jgi:flagellar hook-basal body complex protein FliE